MIKKILSNFTGQKQSNRLADLQRSLIRHEAQIGGQLFGPVPTNVRREFFCLDERTWVWHEEWTDQYGQTKIRMTRYDVRPDGIIKAQGGHYSAVSLNEAENLLAAARLYRQRVTTELYSFAQ